MAECCNVFHRKSPFSSRKSKPTPKVMERPQNKESTGMLCGAEQSKPNNRRKSGLQRSSIIERYGRCLGA